MGLRIDEYYDLINLKVSPWKRSPATKDHPPTLLEGTLSDQVLKFAAFLNADPWSLFAPEQFEPLDTNSAEIEMSAQEVQRLIVDIETAPRLLPETIVERNEVNALVTEALDGLTTREKQIIKMHFYDDVPLREIGERFDISVERVRQIEDKALRKLRNPKRTARLTDDWRKEQANEDIYRYSTDIRAHHWELMRAMNKGDTNEMLKHCHEIELAQERKANAKKERGY